MLGRAGTGRVPTHGLLILPITGRSAAASVPRVSPEGGGSTGAAVTTRRARSGRVRGAHVAHGVGQGVHGAVDGDRLPPSVSETVETVSDPVRARPTT